MDRLTSNKNVSEMNMYELAHNSCYGKDGNARFRDFENDFDARELTRKLLEKYADIPNEFACDDDFDDFIADALQYGTDDILGLIAVFYRNLWAMADFRETLKKYEDLEEQGKLMKLPCKPEDKLYWVSDQDEDAEFSYEPIEEVEICNIDYNGYSLQLWFADKGAKEFPVLEVSSIGKELFYTREEAESALKELEGKEDREIPWRKTIGRPCPGNAGRKKENVIRQN